MNLKQSTLKDLIDIQGRILAENFTLAELLDFICVKSQRLAEGEGGAIEFVSGESLEYVATSGSSLPHRGLIVAVANGFSGLALRERKAMICNDTETDTRVDREACRKMGIRSMVIVPLPAGNTIAGVLKVVSSRPNSFDVQSVEALTMISSFLGSAIHRTESAHQLTVALESARQEIQFRDRVSELIPDNIYIFDLSFQSIVYSSKNLGVFLGYSFEHFQKLGAGFIPSVIHPDDYKILGDHLKQFENATDDAIIEFECRAKNALGEWIWLKFRESVFKRDDSGTPLQLIGIVTDSTDRKNQQIALEERIRERTNELNRLSEHLPQLIWPGQWRRSLRQFQVG